MTPLISVLLATATTLFGLAIAIAKGDLLKSAPGWLVPLLFTISAALYILAAILALMNWRRERKKDGTPPPPPAPPVEVHQENKQEFNPTFSPQQNVFIGTNPEAVAAERENQERETLVLEYMKKIHPTVPYTIDEIANNLDISMPTVRNIMERLKAKKVVWSVNLDQAVGGVGYFLDELHRPQPAPPTPKKPNTVTTYRLDKDDKPMP